jgi:hypothetical protein
MVELQPTASLGRGAWTTFTVWRIKYYTMHLGMLPSKKIPPLPRLINTRKAAMINEDYVLGIGDNCMYRQMASVNSTSLHMDTKACNNNTK